MGIIPPWSWGYLFFLFFLVNGFVCYTIKSCKTTHACVVGNENQFNVCCLSLQGVAVAASLHSARDPGQAWGCHQAYWVQGGRGPASTAQTGGAQPASASGVAASLASFSSLSVSSSSTSGASRTEFWMSGRSQAAHWLWWLQDQTKKLLMSSICWNPSLATALLL